MIRPAIPIRRITMPRQHNPRPKLHGPLQRILKIFYLEPQQHAIPIRSIVRVSNPPMIVFDRKAVQLQHQFTFPNQPLILWSAMIAHTAQ